MIAQTLDGLQHKWTIPENIAKGSKRESSKLHQTAKLSLRKKYPNVDIYEETPIRIWGTPPRCKYLYLDLLVPSLNLAIEVHGQQHYSYNSFYQKNKMKFLQQKKNDQDKARWCELNNLDLVILPYNEMDKWDQLI